MRIKHTGPARIRKGGRGYFDGRGHKIRGNITSAACGIISGLSSDGVIKNLNTEDLNNTGWGYTSFVSGSSAASSDTEATKHPVKIYNVNVNASLLGTNGNFVGMFIRKYVKQTQVMNVTFTNTLGNGVDPTGFKVTLFPANYFNASTRFNHLTWNACSTVGTNQVINGIDAVPAGVTVNY